MKPRALLAMALIAGPLALAATIHGGYISLPAEAVAGTAEPLPFEVGGPFALIDHNGAPRDHADFQGQAQIVYFGYTACPNTCSTALATIAAALDDRAASGADVGAIFITVDPAHDTPARLAEFVPRIHPRLVGLTGDRADIARVQQAWRIDANQVAAGLFDHAPVAYLMGPESEVLTLFPPILPPERLAAIIRGYL